MKINKNEIKIILKFIGLFMLTNMVAFVTTPFVYSYLHWNTTYYLSIFVALGIILIVWAIMKLIRLPHEQPFRHGVEHE